MPAKDSPKAVAKMRKQVRKTKDVLSANHEAPTSCEGMHEDVDFRGTITRVKFEEIMTSVGLQDRAVAGGGIRNKHSIDVASPPPPPPLHVCLSGFLFRTSTRPTLNILLRMYTPRVCMSIHPEG